MFKLIKVKYKKNKNKSYCMKIIKKSRIKNEKDYQHILEQRKILQQLDHPFITKLNFSFQTDRKLYIITDYIQGGSLLYHIRNLGKFKEEIAKIYLAQIILAIEYLHKKSIIYRSLTPETICLDLNGYIKLNDFSFSKSNIFYYSNCTSTFCGTSEYLAPEIIEGKKYGKCVDIWCLGILMYEMIFGFPPFIDDNLNKLYKKIILNEPNFNFDNVKISKLAKDLIMKMLNKNVDKRIGIYKIKKHDFFQGINFNDLLNKKIQMPIIPSNNENEYIDPELLKNECRDSLSNSFSNLYKNDYEDFDYSNISFDDGENIDINFDEEIENIKDNKEKKIEDNKKNENEKESENIENNKEKENENIEDNKEKENEYIEENKENEFEKITNQNNYKENEYNNDKNNNEIISKNENNKNVDN